MSIAESLLEQHEEGPAEVVSGAQDALPNWEKGVFLAGRGICANCGSVERIRPRLIVPLEAGGQYVVSNGVLLCRACEIAAGAALGGRGDAQRRPVDFYMSRRTYDTLQMCVGLNGFQSANALIRYMVSKFVQDPMRFDDLEQYQDAETGEVKFNVWIDAEKYQLFKGILDRRGMTVTDALKSLILMYSAIKQNQVDENPVQG